jgi:sterol desaturase/sphingolipid hydroxylase (fatty acid hydroxylase superfamily)
MILFLAALGALLYSSLIEYCLHRYILHRSYEEDHIKSHHKTFHGQKSYEIKDFDAYEIISDAKEIFRNIVLYLPLAVIIFNFKSLGGIIFFLACVVYSLWSEYLHLSFHKSTGGIFKGLGLFKKLKEHHRIHHYVYNSNYGIGSSFWDKVFRTKKD